MDGGLDDPLVRMHRWDALRQRLANSAAGRLGPVVDEVVEAIATVLYRHGPVTVTVTVEGIEARTTVQLGWQDGQLMVTRHEGPQPAASRPPANGPPANGPPANGPPANGPPVQPGESSEEIAARLAELIRRDPSLLEGRDNWGAPRPGGHGVSD
jgi:hypothetical protein